MKVKGIIGSLSIQGGSWFNRRGVIGNTTHALTGRLTIQGNLNDDLPKGTMNSILKQAGIK